IPMGSLVPSKDWDDAENPAPNSREYLPSFTERRTWSCSAAANMVSPAARVPTSDHITDREVGATMCRARQEWPEPLSRVRYAPIRRREWEGLAIAELT